MSEPVTRRIAAAVPTLDALAGDPSLVDMLPRHTLADLYMSIARLEALVRARLLALRPDADRATGSEPDRALGIDEAAAMLQMTKDYLYRSWSKLGLGFKDADGRVKFPLSRVQRYIRARAGR